MYAWWPVGGDPFQTAAELREREAWLHPDLVRIRRVHALNDTWLVREKTERSLRESDRTETLHE